MKSKTIFGLIISILLSYLSFSQEIISVNNSWKKSSNHFIENKGQINDQYNNPNPSVLYLLNTPGMNVQLRKFGFSYDLFQILNNEKLRSAAGARDSKLDSSGAIYKFQRIDFDLVGSNPACEIIASGTSPNYWNCYTTGTPVKGVTNIRSFETVTYKNIYPGIDMEFLTDGEHGVKYNFVVNPGGKLSSIRMKIMGPEIDITSTGSLKLTTTIARLEEEIPHSFYRLNDRTADVKCRFYQIRQGIYGFSADQRFPENSTLLIDPVPQRLWSTYYGGNDVDFAVSMSLDPNGNIIITGQTLSVNNMATSGSFQTIYAGNADGYFAKFNPAGLLLFGTYFGGPGNDGSKYCCISEDGSIYLAGTTNS
ncbi:MAG: SBBP repeat-containing protein, partial [Bacteroidota bacterium]